MSNMSFCRFENTAQDLYDVVENWNETSDEDLSETERDGKSAIVEFAKRILEMEGEI